MDFNSVSSYGVYDNSAYSPKNVSNTKADSVKDTEGRASSKSAGSQFSEVAATYEPSSSKVTSTKDRSAIIAQLKADSEARMAQMQSLVTRMFEKQGITIGTADDMWKVLASGDFTADAETIAQAKADIAEDGYWGVNQTSERIFSFAEALSGGDDEKMQEMVKAFEKGFKEATKTWGKDLPEISNNTYSAVMDKFDNWFKENNSTATTESILG